MTIHTEHFGDAPVVIGQFKLWPGGALYFINGDFDNKGECVVLVPLAEEVGIPPNIMRAGEYSLLSYPMRDFGAVPRDWEAFLKDKVVPKLEAGCVLMPFCKGGHGRTGTFLASLVALLEPSVSDPIAAIRQRYCPEAVETMEQAEAIFALAGRPIPDRYVNGDERFLSRGELIIRYQANQSKKKKKK